MSEFEELRLTVTLVDNATAGIKALRVELRQVEADSNRFRQKMQELARDHKDFGTNINVVNARTAALAAAAGYAGSKINELQDKVYEQATAIGRFAREMQQINNAARLMGISFGHLNSIIEQGKQFGLDEGTIKNITAAMITLQAQLKTKGGIDRFREEMKNKFKLDPQDFEGYIDRLRGATTVAEFHKALVETADHVEEKEFERTGDRELAKKLRQDWIIKQGMPAQLSLLKALNNPTQEYLDRQKTIIEAANRWNETFSDISKNLESIRDTFFDEAMSTSGSFYKGLVLGYELVKVVENNLESWLGKIRTISSAFMKGVRGLLEKPGAGQMPPELFGGGAKKQSFQTEQIDELTEEITKVNALLRLPSGSGIVPASLTTGGVTGGGLAGTPGGGFGGPGAPFGGGGVPSGGPGGSPRSPGGGGGPPGGGPPAQPPAQPPGGGGGPYGPSPPIQIPGRTPSGAPYNPRQDRGGGGGDGRTPGTGGGGTPGTPGGAGGTSGTPGTPGQRTADIPFPKGGSEAERGGALYDKLLAEFRANPPEGLPPDAARFGITKGTPEEWARFGVAVAAEESGFNPRVANENDPGGSYGVFQYAHGQAYGNAYDVDNSVRAFVRDVRSSSTDKRGLGGGILGQRFSVIGRNPQRTIRSLPRAERIAQQRREQQRPDDFKDFAQGGYSPIPGQEGGLSFKERMQRLQAGLPPGQDYTPVDRGLMKDMLERGLEPGTPEQIAKTGGVDTSKLGPLPDQKDRPFYVGGTLSVGGEDFPYGTGGGMGGAQKGSSPYGTFPVHLIPQLGGQGKLGDIGKSIGSIATVGDIEGTLADPKYGGNRYGIQIHPVSGADLDKLYTAGCFGIPRKDWPRFKAALIRANQEAGGKLFLTVDKSGRAFIGGEQVAPTVAEAAAAGVKTGPTADPAGQPIGTAQPAIKTSEFSLPAVPADYVPKVLPGTATKIPTAAPREEDTAPEGFVGEEGGFTPAYNKPGGYSPVDRSFLDGTMGKKITLPKADGEGKVSIKVDEPKDLNTPKDLFKKDKVTRQENMTPAKSGPTVEVGGGADEPAAEID